MTKPSYGCVNISRYLLPLFFLFAIGTLGANAQRATGDWPQFGWDLASSSAPTYATGITAANAGTLTRRQVTLDGTVDSSAIYLRGVTVKGSKHDVFFVTTTYGKTIAVDAAQGTILWEYTPPKYDALHGTAQITNSSPVADPDREYIYTAVPDGTIQKLAISDGHAIWTTTITLMPLREKIGSALKVFHGRVIAATGGYVGDRPPYQGHVVTLDAQSGQLLHVWNSLCSDRTALFMPSTCPQSDSAIWGRAGAVIDATGNIFVATGNGDYDGKTSWGDAVIELNPDASKIIGNYTPANNAELNRRDLDVGSTSPAMLGGDLIAQGGKDGVIWLISIKAMAGSASHMGGELQTVPTPSAARQFPTAPAVWHHGADTWLFAADFGATAAWSLKDGKLSAMWKNSNGGTSPVVAGGLLYVYDSGGGGLRIYDPVKGTQLADLECGGGHWNSPIVVDGKIALPEGNANTHATTGVLDIWSLQKK